jgi:16S rRNA (cytosine967-C5)-methyltransferase
MSRYHAYLNSALRFIGEYDGKIPLASALKKFFATDRKYGSGDRKIISGICFSYFRMGKALPDADPESHLLTGTQLCKQADPERFTGKSGYFFQSSAFLEKPLPTEEITEAIIRTIFPWPEKTAAEFDVTGFSRSLLVQPDVFVRIRNEEAVAGICARLDAEQIQYSRSGTCLRFAPDVPLSRLLDLDKEAVVQDQNSQRVYGKALDHGLRASRSGKKALRVWDCCAASGGKSLLLYDLLGGNLELTVSDKRESMRPLLEERFNRAGIRSYQWLTTDLSRDNPDLPAGPFDIVLCDVPCTGSGTWARNPEQLYFFDEAALEQYSQLQKNIVRQALKRLDDAGWLLYTTCSVFSAENEENTAALTEHLPLDLLHQELLCGSSERCDSLFSAVMRKRLDVEKNTDTF